MPNQLVMEALRQVAELKMKLDELRPLNKEQEAIVMQKFRLDWNYHSNKIEGNSLSYGETKALILFGITAQGKPLKDHIEITGHNEAVKWIEELVHQDFPIHETFIRKLHELLLKEPYWVNAITSDGQPTKKLVNVGQYKKEPNHVLTKTGEIFRFATPEETPAKMHDLIEWFRTKQNESDLSPVILAAEFHYKFIRIHPFDDGNGRLARILMNLILMQYGFPPVIIKTEDKAAYYSALQQADAGLFEPFVEYIVQNEIRSLDIMIRGAKGESIEEPDDLDKELALLEQKMKGELSQIQTIKSKGQIRAIYSHSLETLLQELMKMSEKFRRFYETSSYSLVLDGDIIQVIYDAFNQNFVVKDSDSVVKNVKMMITGKIECLSFICSFYRLKQFETEKLSYEGRIDVFFKANTYLVSKYEKSSIELLTDNEIQTIVNTEAVRHKEFIESKINEIQQNAGNQ